MTEQRQAVQFLVDGGLSVQSWLAQSGGQTLYIEPGKPWQNGKEERFNGTVRDECLNLHIFTPLAEAYVRLSAFRQHYNSERPHSQLGYLTPLTFKAAWLEAQAKQCFDVLTRFCRHHEVICVADAPVGMVTSFLGARLSTHHHARSCCGCVEMKECF